MRKPLKHPLFLHYRGFVIEFWGEPTGNQWTISPNFEENWSGRGARPAYPSIVACTQHIDTWHVAFPRDAARSVPQL